MPSIRLTLHAGDAQLYASQLADHLKLKAWLADSGASYGLPTDLTELDDVGVETLGSIYPDTPSPLPLTPPSTLALPPLLITHSPSSGLKRTTANFLALASSPPQYKSKRSPYPELSYLSPMGSRVFRIERDFVAQMGDVTRGDGSGGESIYGGTFNDDKEGLKTAFTLGTVGMASGSAKNSNTSQFFLTLTSSPTQLSKLTSKHVAFGQIAPTPEHTATLARLSEMGDAKGGTTLPVWIGGMEVLED